MAAELWVLVLLVLRCGADGGTWMSSRATNLAGRKETYGSMDAKATYLACRENEPNRRNSDNETYYEVLDVRGNLLDEPTGERDEAQAKDLVQSVHER